MSLPTDVASAYLTASLQKQNGIAASHVTLADAR